MSTEVAYLKVLGNNITNKKDPRFEILHQINRLIPDDQKLISVGPDYTANNALKLIDDKGISQVPVIKNGEVLGVFSYRSYAKKSSKYAFNDIKGMNCGPGDMNVDEFLETWSFAHVKEDMGNFLDIIEKNQGILIGAPDNIIAIVTPSDLINYLYRISRPYILVKEIELAVRNLISDTLSDDELEKTAHKALKFMGKKGRKIPTSLNNMVFENYSSIITYKEVWNKFHEVFSTSTWMIRYKLKEIARIRNITFHFKGEITIEDNNTLSDYRDWFLSRVTQDQ